MDRLWLCASLWMLVALACCLLLWQQVREVLVSDNGVLFLMAVCGLAALAFAAILAATR